MPLPPARSYVRQFATAGIDGLLALGAYYTAHIFRHGGEAWTNTGFTEALPLVFTAKMIALAIFRANNRVWRYTNSHDLLAMAQASTVGSALAVVAVASVHGLDGFRAVLALDWILLTASLGASRLALRGMAEFLRPVPTSAARVIIYGAGDGGVALLQELRNNPSLTRTVVAFVDDDPMKQQTRVQGTPVFAAADGLADLLREMRAEELILATTKVEPARIEALRATCAASGARLSRFRLSVENLPSLAQVRSIR